MQCNLFSERKYRFFSLGSGSSGNCYYLGTDKYGILIDAGVGIRTVKKTLKEYGIGLDKIAGVLVTHDHADHIKTISCLGDKFAIPVYTTQTIHEGIKRNRYINASLITSTRVIEKEKAFNLIDFEITAFEVPHDSIDNVGYRICFDDQVFVLITDVGRITETIHQYARGANHLVMEANYDELMLRNGRYPIYLKNRIMSGTGHLSNDLAAQFIADIHHDKMTNIWLCHLSQDNNSPDLAYKTVEESLRLKGIITGRDIHLESLSRFKASGLKEF